MKILQSISVSLATGALGTHFLFGFGMGEKTCVERRARVQANESDTSMFMVRDVNFGVRTRGYVYSRCSSRAPKLLVAVYRLSDAYNLQSTRPQ